MKLLTKCLETLCERRKVQRLCYAIACVSYFLDGLLNTAIVSTVPLQMQDEIKRPGKLIYNGTDAITSHVFTNQAKSNSSYAITSTSLLTTGLLFASKSIVQVIMAPVAGIVIDKFLYELPLLFGVSLQFITTIVYFIHDSYWFMVCARAVQGIGSAFSDPAAMGLVSELYPDNVDRVFIICVLSAIISSSNMLGPLYGGFLDEYVNKWIPFAILAVGLFIEMLLIMLAIYPVRKERSKEMKDNLATTKLEATPINKLIMDPYVLLCCGGMFVGMVTLVVLQSTIAIWMRQRFQSTETEIGFVYAPCFISFTVAIFTMMFISKTYPSKQWLIAIICMAAEGVACLLIPFSPSYGLLIVILMIFTFNQSVAETIIYATFPRIVDMRYVPVYGSIYSIAMFSYNMCYALAPIFGNFIFAASSFTVMIVINALMKILYAPLLIFLKNLYDIEPTPSEKQQLVRSQDTIEKKRISTANISSSDLDNLNKTFEDHN